MKYTCPVCGYVYDEAVQGAKWSELPADWECPVCGAPKSVFVPEPEEQAKNDSVPMPEQTEEAAKAAEYAVDMPLSVGELAAVCANLARGCEKMYMGEECELFLQLSRHYLSLVPPVQGDVAALSKAVASAAQKQFALSKATAENAGDRGAQRAIVWGERVNFVLRSLIEKYEAEGYAALTADRIWVCSVCGFIYIGEVPPAVCPVCKVPSFKFEKGDAAK